jgi:hypothetical protein
MDRDNMSTALKGLSSFHLRPQTDMHCAIAVIYDDTATRERALWLCHHLVREFWAEIDFQFSWWRFRYLNDPEIARAAAQAAIKADVLIFSAREAEDLPGEVRDWVDAWLPHKRGRPSVLLGMVGDQGASPGALSPLGTCLHEIAQRGGMDYLAPPHHESLLTTPGSLRKFQDRAEQMTQVLDEILHHVGPPPSPLAHWGINE